MTKHHFANTKEIISLQTQLFKLVFGLKTKTSNGEDNICKNSYLKSWTSYEFDPLLIKERKYCLIDSQNFT